MSFRYDSHVHVMPPKRLAALMRWIHRGFPGYPIDIDISQRQILRDLRRSGVTRFFNLVYPLDDAETESLNDWNLDFCAATPGAIPFGSMFVDTPNKAQLAEKLFARGCAGIKFHPFVQKFDPGDGRFDPLYSFMNEARKPLLLHTGFDEWYGASLPVAVLHRIAERFPNMGLVLVHMIFPHLRQALKMAADFDNVWLDATNVPGSFRFAAEKGIPLPKELAVDFIEGLKRFGNRAMYGSDYPVGMGTLKDILQDIKKMGADDEIYCQLTENAPEAFLNRYGNAENVGSLTELSLSD